MRPGAQSVREAMLLLAAVQLYDDSFLEAADLLERALDESPDNLAFRVRMLIMLAYALFNGGRPEPRHARVDDAVASRPRLDQPELLSQALGMRATLRFVLGEGLDEDDMRRALEFDDYPRISRLPPAPPCRTPCCSRGPGSSTLPPSEWRRSASAVSSAVRRVSSSFVGFHSCLLQVWRGNFAEAELVAEDTMERALQLGGDLPLFIALTIRAMLGAYAGRVDEARRDTAEALAASQRCGSHRLCGVADHQPGLPRGVAWQLRGGVAARWRRFFPCSS